MIYNGLSGDIGTIGPKKQKNRPKQLPRTLILDKSKVRKNGDNEQDKTKGKTKGRGKG